MRIYGAILRVDGVPDPKLFKPCIMLFLNYQTRNDDIKKGNFSILKQLFFVFRNNFKLEFKSLLRFIM